MCRLILSLFGRYNFTSTKLIPVYQICTPLGRFSPDCKNSLALRLIDLRLGTKCRPGKPEVIDGDDLQKLSPF